jgi:O-antigen/teichoic acid export membrane protein
MRDLVFDTAIYMLGRGIPALLGFATVALLVRILGERSYGLYSIVFAGGNFLATLSIGWLSQAILRFRPAESDWGKRFGNAVGKGIGWACAFGVTATVALLVFAPQQFSRAVVLLASCVLVVGLIWHIVFTASLQAVLRSRAVAAMEILRAAIAIPAGVLGALTVHPPFAGAVGGIGIAYVISGLWARTLASRQPHDDRSATAGAVAGSVRKLLAFGWPISLWLGATMAFPFAERTVIQYYLGATAMGRYAAIYDVIYRSTGFALLPIVLAIHPRIMKAHGAGRTAESHRLWAVALAMQVGVAALVVLAVTGAGRWILLVIGVRASGTALSLVLPLAAAGCVWQIALVSHKLLEAHKQTPRMLAFLFAALSTDVAIDIALVPRFGVMAAAYALLVAGMLYVICVSVDGLRVAARASASGQHVRSVTPT